MSTMRKQLSAPGLLEATHKCFTKAPDVSRKQKKVISLVDCLMSGVAVFGLKFPSLLQYDQGRAELNVRHNLRMLYHVKEAPSDTYLREVLDNVQPSSIFPAFKRIFALVQRGKILEKYEYLDGCYLLSLDGTGQYSSETVHCDNCCEKKHRSGKVTYYHQMLGAVLVHPKLKQVIPFAPEPITKQDGATKNDCERNAAKRMLPRIRREHAHLKLIVVEDGLSSNAPHIELLKKLDMRFILGAKEGDHKELFEWVSKSQYKEWEFVDGDNVKHKFRFINKVPLNDANFSCEVNFLEYWEIQPSGKALHFSWVTDIELNELNAEKIMRAGRARWKIENETFNTLKNQGYNFEHNYGHGENQLCSVLTMLMMLAFLIDQVQAMCCACFKKIRAKIGCWSVVWERMRAVFSMVLVDSWERFYRILHDPYGLLTIIDN